MSKQDTVVNEAEALIDNFNTLKEVADIFKNCQAAYKIIQTNYDRGPEDPQRVKVIIDLLDKSRYFIGELLERFKVMERNYAATKLRKKETDKAKEDLFRSFLPTIEFKLLQR